MSTTKTEPKKLRIGYVPEHFCTPLLQLIESDPELAKTVELIPNPSGTGQMISGLKDRSLDVAIALTESLIAGIILGKEGSQVMGSVMALQHGWLANTPEPVEFVVKDSFKNLRDSVNDGSTAAFMWEWFTTKPYQDSGEVKFIGNVPTPWSSWVVVASPEEVNPDVLVPSRLTDFLKKLDQSIHQFGIEKGVRKPEHVEYIKNRFE
ncbi:hypothetical protein CROQUDRAFT_671553 [Cronartium quercuum f. sp. fusiforme G11]|uniref:Ca3427-like PBP 2 domain-containing protein n=1 Tax=Cronartium quercuum f. sp. fusiforme G11 TaxID=708437 RepID=A0A9P6TBJ3_9BASI|nr:hypothetical protein CROQUDRAFT_671553 [Cronartium quercuum f. sp. fusiforme G11]